MGIIARLTSTKELPATFAHFAKLGISNPFGVGVRQDPKVSTVNIVSVTQSGLGMPDRDYYLRKDAAITATRSAYVAYITRLLTLGRQPDPAGAAQQIVALETAIATPQWEDRLSGQVEELLEARHQARRSARQRASRGAVPVR